VADNPSQDDFVTHEEWLTTPEGWAAQANVWMTYIVKDELIARQTDSKALKLMDYVDQDTYGRASTQLMLI
jgi:hypothetical protein